MQNSKVGGVSFIDVMENWMDKCMVEDIAFMHSLHVVSGLEEIQ